MRCADVMMAEVIGMQDGGSRTGPEVISIQDSIGAESNGNVTE